MYSSLLLACVSFAAGGLAASACTGPQYNDMPSFGYNSGCYPLGYYQTSDLGQTSPDDARSRCQQQCANAGGQCGSAVAQVNKAADSNLYSGACFLYAPGNTPASPRQCADRAYLLGAYMKDSTNSCFSSSSSVASAFCSSYLGVPVSTVSTTTTSTPPVVTVTATSTTKPTISVTTTTTTTPTVTVSASTIITSTVSTQTSTVFTSVSSFTTVTSTITSTVTVTAAAKMLAKRASPTVPPPACVASGAPSTRLSAACSCLSVKTSTTTRTITSTLVAVTTTTTSTTTMPVTSTVTLTATAVPTTTTITGIVISSVTATSIVTSTNTIPVTLTVTQPSVTTVVVAPTCTNQKFFKGPSSTCYYNQYCQQAITGIILSGPTTVNNDDACFASCDGQNKYKSVKCYGYTYQSDTHLCTLYSYEDHIAPAGPNFNTVYFSYCVAPS